MDKKQTKKTIIFSFCCLFICIVDFYLIIDRGTISPNTNIVTTNTNEITQNIEETIDYKYLTISVKDYNTQLLSGIVTKGNDMFTEGETIILSNYRSKYPAEIVMHNKDIIIKYIDSVENVIIPEKILFTTANI